MSLYQEKIMEKAYKIEDSMNYLVPPNYKEILRRHNEYYQNNSTISFNMIITNLRVQEDYDTIVEALKDLKGVMGVSGFQPQKLTVAYNKNLIGLESIVYHISKLGYRYVNRF